VRDTLWLVVYDIVRLYTNLKIQYISHEVTM
jgi:hypothetical protein